jgi:t-SNARE complex subunit (syntaxin)
MRAEPCQLKTTWESDVLRSIAERSWIREEIEGDINFGEYQQAVKERLLNHNVLCELAMRVDPFQQDRLTTWLEYVNYELWWYDHYISKKVRLQLQHEQDLEKLKHCGLEHLTQQAFVGACYQDLIGWIAKAREAVIQAAASEAEAAPSKFAVIDAQ